MATRPTAAASRRPSARSLHIGLNLVSGAAYEGWTGPLAACEFDANDMAAIAKSKGMAPTVLLTKKATRAAVLSGMRAAAKALKAGDLFFLSYSGHGGQVKDANGDEPDKKDETWCLYDGQLIDDELYFELSRFAAGVRVLVLSDSCHSGSVTREVRPPPPPPGQREKLMPDAVALRVYSKHQVFYDKLQADVKKAAGKVIVDPDQALAQVGAAAQAAAVVGVFKPAVVLISGCQDNQTSMDGEHNGAFTEKTSEGVEQRRLHGQLQRFPLAHPRRLAGQSVAQPVRAGAGCGLPGTEAVHGLTRRRPAAEAWLGEPDHAWRVAPAGARASGRLRVSRSSTTGSRTQFLAPGFLFDTMFATAVEERRWTPQPIAARQTATPGLRPQFDGSLRTPRRQFLCALALVPAAMREAPERAARQRLSEVRRVARGRRRCCPTRRRQAPEPGFASAWRAGRR